MSWIHYYTNLVRGKHTRKLTLYFKIYTSYISKAFLKVYAGYCIQTFGGRYFMKRSHCTQWRLNRLKMISRRKKLCPLIRFSQEYSIEISCQGN